jgi:predicted acylesterase/phospholipase RssA
LSGGGFRATFFHLGVVRALRQHGYLKRVDKIYSVSGGSILAAHMVLNWDKYCSNVDAEFEEMAAEISNLGYRNVRGHVVTSFLATLMPQFAINLLLSLPRRLTKKASFQFQGRTLLLQREYDRIYKNKTLGDISKFQDNVPEINILSTSLISGQSYAFSNGKIISQITDRARTREITTHNWPVSKAVAASSAFPPLFPPVPVERERLGVPKDVLNEKVDYLTDGGVFDNLGIGVAFAAMSDEEKKEHHFFVSDACAPFNSETKSTFSMLLSRALRTTDILMERVTKNAREKGDAESYLSYVNFGIDSETDPIESGLSPEVQRDIPKIRTDLDKFNTLEQNVLKLHGYSVACMTLNKPMEDLGERDVAEDQKSRGSILPPVLPHQIPKKSFESKIFPIIWSSPATYVLFGILLLPVAITGLGYYLANAATQEIIVANNAAAESERRALDSALELTSLENTLNDNARNQTIPQNPVLDLIDEVRGIYKNDFIVTLQFGGALSRSRTLSLAGKLAENGWIVPSSLSGGERTTSAFGRNEVMYQGERGMIAALKLAQEVREIDPEFVLRVVEMESDGRTPSNILEIWMSIN